MRKVIGMLIVVMSCVILQGCHSVRQSEELSLGKNTFNSGDFKSAYKQLLPLAVEGNPDAQYAVGYMCYYGYGVPQDSYTGIFWMRRAADQGNPAAIRALRSLDQANHDKFIVK